VSGRHSEPIRGLRSAKASPLLQGPCGRIVAQVSLGLLAGDNKPFLNMHPLWQPESGATYALKDFVSYALKYS
jgi:hypothetical protein